MLTFMPDTHDHNGEPVWIVPRSPQPPIRLVLRDDVLYLEHMPDSLTVTEVPNLAEALHRVQTYRLATAQARAILRYTDDGTALTLTHLDPDGRPVGDPTVVADSARLAAEHPGSILGFPLGPDTNSTATPDRNPT